VTNYLYPLVVGWAPWFTAVNLNTWNRMDPQTRQFFEANFRKLEDAYWDNTAKEAQDGINCNTGQGECMFGTKGHMKLVLVTDADKATLMRVARDVVVKKWAERCGADCARDWNNSVGKAIGLSIDAK
jgi:TRAP-type C4-dicarboxylate transport system substrate-binding protein